MSDLVDKNTLKSFVPPSALNAENFQELAGKTFVEDVPAGKTVFKEGDNDRQSVYLVDGQVEAQQIGDPPRCGRCRHIVKDGQDRSGVEQDHAVRLPRRASARTGRKRTSAARTPPRTRQRKATAAGDPVAERAVRRHHRRA